MSGVEELIFFYAKFFLIISNNKLNFYFFFWLYLYIIINTNVKFSLHSRELYFINVVICYINTQEKLLRFKKVLHCIVLLY